MDEVYISQWDALQEEFKKSHGGKRLMLIDTAPTIVPAEGCSETRREEVK